MTCQHKPFLANNDQLTQAWDTCMGPGLNTTIDAGEKLQPNESLHGLDAGCIISRLFPRCTHISESPLCRGPCLVMHTICFLGYASTPARASYMCRESALTLHVQGMSSVQVLVKICD